VIVVECCSVALQCVRRQVGVFTLVEQLIAFNHFLSGGLHIGGDVQ